MTSTSLFGPIYHEFSLFFTFFHPFIFLVHFFPSHFSPLSALSPSPPIYYVSSFLPLPHAPSFPLPPVFFSFSSYFFFPSQLFPSLDLATQCQSQIAFIPYMVCDSQADDWLSDIYTCWTPAVAAVLLVPPHTDTHTHTREVDNGVCVCVRQCNNCVYMFVCKRSSSSSTGRK